VIWRLKQLWYALDAWAMGNSFRGAWDFYGRRREQLRKKVTK